MQKNGLTQFVMGLGMVVFAQNLHLIECGAALTFADGAGVVNIQQMQGGDRASFMHALVAVVLEGGCANAHEAQRVPSFLRSF